jgi:hypothetical protein
MQPDHRSIQDQQHTSIPAIAKTLKASGTVASFDAWMWKYIRTSTRKKQHIPPDDLPAKSRMNDDEIEDSIELAWKFLEDRKYHRARETCQTSLTNIEHDLARDFGQNLQTSTLYEDPDEERREHYLDVLNVYQKTLRSLVLELLLETDDIQDIDPNYERYQALQSDMLHNVSKVTYILGWDYDSQIFLTSDDVEHFDELVREHCQYLLKSEFFKTFKIVIQTLGSLDRKNFHLITEPYRNLRGLCDRCLEVIALMKDERFFGPEDTFVEDYERDVNLYLQILWYLAIKTDLNKIEKFLHPNTYSGGLDVQCQIFAAVSLMEEILPHLRQAQSVGLCDRVSQDIIETYAEYWYCILKHEEESIRRETEHVEENQDRLEHIQTLKVIIEQHTIQHTKTKSRVDFAYKLFLKTRFALRLQDHRLVTVENPEGRILRQDITLHATLTALDAPIFTSFFHQLRLQYRSRNGVKLQKLRWSWFAERSLPDGYFDTPKYNYLKYIHARWKEKVQAHYKALHQLSRRDGD